MNNKSFCIYPWIHQYAKPTGHVGYCCIAHQDNVKKDDGTDFDLSKDKLEDAWNSTYMKNLREDMYDGNKITGCETCYFQEKIGKESYRIRHNNDWTRRLGKQFVESLVEDSKKNNFIVSDKPRYFDLRLGNLCNLKCRMCNPFNSTQIEKEWNSIDNNTNGEMSKFWANRGVHKHSIEPWYESEIFWDSIDAAIPFLHKVYMTGGEPTLINKNYEFLEKCIDWGYADKIELFFNLNFTNMTDKFIDLINQFKWTNINASFDGIGSVNDYIRSPSNWNKLSENFAKLAKYGGNNIGLGISPVIQVYNILDIIPLLEWVEKITYETEKDILVDFLYCKSPKFLDPIILPQEIKLIALNQLKEYKSRPFYNRNSAKANFLKNSVDSCISMLEQNLDILNKHEIEEFKKYTKLLDNERKVSFLDTFPVLSKFI